MRRLCQIGPAAVAGGLIATLFAQSDPAEKSARNIFETKCAVCHGSAQMSGLDLRERATILRGGKRGPAIVPGNRSSIKRFAAKANCRCLPATPR